MNRSILKSNSPRQNFNSPSQTKVPPVRNGIFRKSVSCEVNNAITSNNSDNNELPAFIRETRSESISQNKEHYKSIVS